MKKLFLENNVPCPSGGKLREVIDTFENYPAFIKPDDMYASVGITSRNVVHSKEDALKLADDLE
jgi:D-alanine-D-alanine ligase-like ATP-grasp enzyme